MRAPPPTDVRGVMDFARALEHTAHAVVQPWAALPLDDSSRPPTPDGAANALRLDIGDEDQEQDAPSTPGRSFQLRIPEVAGASSSGLPSRGSGAGMLLPL